MEKIQTNSTEKFKDTVGNLTVNFRKTVSGNNVTIYAEITQNENKVGTLTYDRNANYLILTLKPYSDVSKDDVKAVYAKVSEWIDELI